MSGTELQEAIRQRIVVTVMRSRKYYSTVQGNRRTVPICIGDLEFRRAGCRLRSSVASELSMADTVSMQKNGDRGTTVTQHRTEPLAAVMSLCPPVRALAKLVGCIANYKVVNEAKWWENIADRPTNLVQEVSTRDSTTEITSTQVLNHLRAAASQYGEDRLGFPMRKLWTHSIRSGVATAMFVAGVPVKMIKLIRSA